MLDKASFMEALHEVMKIAETSEKPMGREELRVYFKDMELNSEQEELIYQYMQKEQDKDNTAAEGLRGAVDGSAVLGDDLREIHDKDSVLEEMDDKAVVSDKEMISPVVQELKQSEERQKKAEKAFLNAPYVKMYLKDIRSIRRLKQEELLPYYERLLAGEDEAADVVLHNYLRRVVDIAKRYVLLKVNMEDVVQEGNMGLLLAIKQLKGKGEQKNIKRYIEKEIRQSMEDYINQTMEDDNWEQMVLGRARLLQEAKEALAKELFHVPSVDELSEYTHLPKDEIADIFSLIKEKKDR